MATVVLVIHLMIAIALIVLVLLQRSEGGALGMGGGGGGLMSGRGAANLLTRATGVLAAGFFITSITLAILAKTDRAPTSILDGALPASGQSGTKAGKSALPDAGAGAAKTTAPAKPAGPTVPDSN